LAALPETFVLREVHYQIDTPGFRTHQVTLVTTLLDAEAYRVADLAELYHQRWQVETALAQLKTTMQMDVLHCKTAPGVLKALPVLALIDNRVRLVMCQSAILHHRAVERISCLDALRWLSAPHPDMPLVALSVNPARPHRLEPRVKKRRPKSVPVMMKSRQELRQQLVQQVIRG
jgi:Transposase DDE domain